MALPRPRLDPLERRPVAGERADLALRRRRHPEANPPCTTPGAGTDRSRRDRSAPPATDTRPAPRQCVRPRVEVVAEREHTEAAGLCQCREVRQAVAGDPPSGRARRGSTTRSPRALRCGLLGGGQRQGAPGQRGGLRGDPAQPFSMNTVTPACRPVSKFWPHWAITSSGKNGWPSSCTARPPRLRSESRAPERS